MKLRVFALILFGFSNLPFSNLPFSTCAWAELGGAPISDSTAQVQFHAAAAHRLSLSNLHYSIQELHYSGTSVREYIGTNGKVFAVAWDGRIHPDLTKYLGGYYKGYEQAHAIAPETSREKGNRSYALDAGNMILEKGGHMGHVTGCAYDPRLFPADFTRADLK